MTEGQVKEYLLHHYVMYLREHRSEERTHAPLSLGDWVTVNFSNPLYVQLRGCRRWAERLAGWSGSSPLAATPRCCWKGCRRHQLRQRRLLRRAQVPPGPLCERSLTPCG